MNFARMTRFLSSGSAQEKKARNRGFSMTDTGLALALGAIVGIGVIVYFVQYRGDAKIDEMQQHVQDIIAGTQKLYYQHPVYTGLTTANAVASGLIPRQLVNGTGATNPWGGVTSLAPNSDPSKVDLTSTLIPSAACVELVSVNMAQDNGAVVAIQVNGTAMSLPVDPATAAARCSQAANTVVWTAE